MCIRDSLIFHECLKWWYHEHGVRFFEISDVFTGIAWNITYMQYPVRRDFKTSQDILPPIASGCSSCSSGKQNVRQTCFKAAWVRFFHLRSKQSRHHFAMCLCVSHLSANERKDWRHITQFMPAFCRRFPSPFFLFSGEGAATRRLAPYQKKRKRRWKRAKTTKIDVAIEGPV